MRRRIALSLAMFLLVITSALAPFPLVSQVALAGDEGFDDPVLRINGTGVNHVLWVSDVSALVGTAVWVVTVPEDATVDIIDQRSTFFDKPVIKIVHDSKMKSKHGETPVEVSLTAPVLEKRTQLTLQAIEAATGKVLDSDTDKGNHLLRVKYTVK